MKPQTVNEMASGTARTALSISSYSKGWANSARLLVGTWAVALLTKVRTSASVIATFRPRLAKCSRSCRSSCGLQPYWVSRWPWLPTPCDRDAVVQQPLHEGERGVVLGVAAVLATDVVVVVEEQRVPVGLVGPLEGERDALRPGVDDPPVIRVNLGRVGVGEELVAHVPLPDAAAEAAHLGEDVLLQQVQELGLGVEAIRHVGGQPVGELVVPAQRVATDERVIGVGEVDEVVRPATSRIRPARARRPATSSRCLGCTR